ncbi:MAG TPA: hypothetical protein DCQ31_18595, partial [Bacteroidales bacterium]|nr:hypothetical protein [Bacteroidales bacterium]
MNNFISKNNILMYDYISGKLVELSPAHAVIDAGGVGYSAFISLTSFAALNEQLTAKLYIHQSIREDAHLFFGFAHKS